jgi:RNA polymerase sigma-70 factor (ECF subfamily)
MSRATTLRAGAPTEPPALADWARRARDEGEPALRELLRAAAPLVRRICRGVMGREHPELEDAIQECLIDVARAVPAFRFESPVEHYVTKIAVRRAIALRRRARERSRRAAELDVEVLPAARLDGELQARAELVRALLDDLNEHQAAALLLHVMLGHSIDEVAAITGVSVNTVKTRLRLGKIALRRWLERDGERRRVRR